MNTSINSPVQIAYKKIPVQLCDDPSIPFVDIVEITIPMYRQEAYDWAKRTITFKPFIRVIKNNEGKLFYEVVRVINESKSNGNDKLNSKIGLIYAFPYAFTIDTQEFLH